MSEIASRAATSVETVALVLSSLSVVLNRQIPLDAVSDQGKL